MDSTTAGLGALGFWIFIAAVVVGGIWSDIRRRESQQETLRRMIESGQHLDPAVIDQLLEKGDKETQGRDLRVAGLITAAAAPGLAILGLFLGQLNEKVIPALLGVSVLVVFVSVGLFLAARLVESRSSDNR
jgi:hypothetical protein